MIELVEHPEAADPPSLRHASPAMVRAALVPEDVARFDDQWRAAMTGATGPLDLGGVYPADRAGADVVS